MEKDVTIYTDGAARGNPGPSASGFMAYHGGRLLHKHFEYNGKQTNNYAEYRAILLALEWCVSEKSIGHVRLYSDNELVVRQLNGDYRLKSASLRPLNESVKECVKRLKRVEFGNVRRENIYIKAVDRALNGLLDDVTGR